MEEGRRVRVAGAEEGEEPGVGLPDRLRRVVCTVHGATLFCLG